MNNQKKTTLTADAGTLYDLNKQLILQTATPLTHPELAAIEQKIEDWFNMIIDSYAMLLCYERRDFTVFHLYEKANPNPPSIAAKELINCLNNRGKILSMQENEDKAWEIWLKIEDDVFCYYLFQYDQAVIQC